MMIGQKYVVSTNQNYHSERNEKHEDMKEESNRPLPPVPFCFVGTKRLPSSNDDENKNKSSSSTFGSGGGFVLPSITLKKISPKPIFQNLDEKAFGIKTPTQMLRFIDSLRYHQPTEEERLELNIPSSKERLCLHVLHDMMIICGARRGYRFDSMDINRLRHFAEILEAQYIFVDHLFQTISKPVLQFRFHNINKIQDDIIQLTQVEEFLNVHQEQQMDSRNTTRSYSHLLQTMEIPFQAFHFQYQAQKYIKTFHEYKDSILQIRQRHQELQQEQFLEISSTNEPVVEIEFEAKAQHPFPLFLIVLVRKYRQETMLENFIEWSKGEDPVPSIAEFSLFLGRFILSKTTMAGEEIECMMELLHVLKLEYEVDEQIMAISIIGTNRTSAGTISTPRSWTQMSLAQCIYDFLVTVREFRLIPRRKELLQVRKPPRVTSIQKGQQRPV